MKLFVGLGNPGEKYARNRHNVGFMAVERIAEVHRFGPWKKKFQGLAADGEIAGEKVLLLKPQTYMNDSGRSVGEAARFLKVAIGDIVVLYDEIDLAPGKLKAKAGGGNAGHNGLRSISAHLENDYVRVRIGVGHPGHKDLVAGYVLNDFAKADQVWLMPLLDAIAAAATRLAEGHSERFLTDVARALQPDAGKAADGDPDRTRGKTNGDKTNGDRPKGGGKTKTGAAANAAGEPAGDDETGAQAKPAPRHPSGERAGKRENAIAENLRKWMAGRKKDGA